MKRSKHTSHANRGKALENSLKVYHEWLRGQNVARIKKLNVDKISVGGKLIYLKKEGFDCQGTLKGGRSVCIEAKQYKEDRLPILAENKKGAGIKYHQMEELLWHGSMGALTGVIWYHAPRECYAIGFRFLRDFIDNIYGSGTDKRKSIPLAMVQEECEQIDHGGLLEYIEPLVKSQPVVLG